MANREVIIIGAGPAGIAAAIQLRRYGLQPLVLEKNIVGGLLNNANMVENYPGVGNGIAGTALVDLMRGHAENLAVEIRFEEVSAVHRCGDLFEITTSAETYQAGTVVVASGTKPLHPKGLAIDEAAAGNVFYEVFPLRELSGRTIAIIGAGDAAFDYALNLSGENEVTILNRTDSIKALGLLVERVRSNDNITYEENVCVETVSAADGGRVQVRGRGYQIEVDKVIFAVGREPELEFMGADLQEQNGYYVVGDVKNGLYRQTSIAVADGIRAAMMIHKSLQEKG